ncbi:MAG: acyl-CoA reductase [Bacteroidetes bacterium]|jgi:hypothetical protein|nr:acyl-CoA reductase [Bacteroidota bacterium]
MTLEQRIEVMGQLGAHLLENKDEFLKAILHRTHYKNKWFTIENQEEAIHAIASNFLQKEKLSQWAKKYSLTSPNTPKTVGMVLAGNIPLVGFHDILCVFISGHISQIKLSEKDQFLLPYLIKLLDKFDNQSSNYLQIVAKLKDFDAVIATGSNNSARYFEAYFGKFPNIIRKNRNSIAVLNGKESEADLRKLGADIFKYYGLGCRNVSKIFVPKGFDFEPFLEILHDYKNIILNEKYKHNFDYNYALHLMNKEPFKNNGCLIIREDKAIQSRIASLHYEFYEDVADLAIDLHNSKEQIQCIVSQAKEIGLETVAFGEAQRPQLTDYADGLDTMEFLMSLNA